MEHALAYLRTSSATNVEGDFEIRQRLANDGYAKANGIEIVGEFYDVVVSGTDPVETRPGFSAMLDRIEDTGVRLVIVEDASRFARSLVAQELGVLVMSSRNVRVVTSSGYELTETNEPSRVMMRQFTGAIVQYEKTRLMMKLRAARNRKSEAVGRRIEGRKGYAGHQPAVFDALCELTRTPPTLRMLSEELANRGFTTTTNSPFAPNQVNRLIQKSQRDALRDCLLRYGDDEAKCVDCYVEKEMRGEVARRRNMLSPSQYAKQLWHDGKCKGWLNLSANRVPKEEKS
jgi:DNA invertase Pin-like site-specific DNA recombinase